MLSRKPVRVATEGSKSSREQTKALQQSPFDFAKRNTNNVPRLNVITYWANEINGPEWYYKQGNKTWDVNVWRGLSWYRTSMHDICDPHGTFYSQYFNEESKQTSGSKTPPAVQLKFPSCLFLYVTHNSPHDRNQSIDVFRDACKYGLHRVTFTVTREENSRGEHMPWRGCAHAHRAAGWRRRARRLWATGRASAAASPPSAR